ncbi:MAG TPA: DUF3775 domain-containing protein [Alphaproteobacteria bacterium]|nr:DUF3775 domain-containing protein [Alphaproteobacteria bacterium]
MMVPREKEGRLPVAGEKAEPELSISREKVCYIITRAREFDAKVEPVEPDPGSNPADSGEREVLEDYADDPTLAELRAAIDGLNDDEVVDLIALAWIGRGDFTKGEWQEARALAWERHRHSSAPYLVGMPTLGDYLEEGFAELGYSCADFETGRL